MPFQVPGTKPKRKDVETYGLEHHPQRQAFVNAVSLGHRFATISKWLQPPVSRQTVQNWIVQTKQKLAAADALQPGPLQTVERTDENGIVQTFTLVPIRSFDSKQKIVQLASDALGGSVALANRNQRLAAKQARWDQLNQTVIAERSAAYSTLHDDGTGRMVPAIPGGSSGLLQRKTKLTGDDYIVDRALLREMSEIETEIAKELGQWQESATSATNVAIAIQVVAPASDDRERIGRPDTSVTVVDLPKRRS